MQTFAAIWWASRVTLTLSNLQLELNELKTQIAECRLRSATYDELNRVIATVNEKLADNRKRIEKLEDRRQ